MKWVLSLLPTLLGLYLGYELHPFMGILPGGVIGASAGVVLYLLANDVQSKKIEPIGFSVGLASFAIFVSTGSFIITNFLGENSVTITIGKSVIVLIALFGAILIAKRVELSRLLMWKRASNYGSFIFDTSALLEDKILDLFDIGLFSSKIIVPQFVLAELQKLADSTDDEKKEKGRRGFEIVDKIKKMPDVELIIDDTITYEDGKVDEEIVNLARKFSGQIVTLDYNLTKVAQLQGVKVLNLNHLAELLKPTLLPGQRVSIHIIRRGKNKEQGIGFTEDGTMIVVEDGGDFVGMQREIVITNILRTNAGKLLFGRIKLKP